jgi:hypothetical protein
MSAIPRLREPRRRNAALPAVFAGWARSEPFGAAPDVLAEEHGPEIRETGGRLIERPEDRLSLGAVEAEHGNVSEDRVAELHLERVIVDQACEPQDEPIGDIETGDEHESSVLLFGAAV